MSINERFMTIISELYNGNKRAFSMAIGVTPTVIENVVGARQGKPSFNVLEKVCANAKISAEWLMTGRGSMLSDEEEEAAPTGSQPFMADERLMAQGDASEFFTKLLDRLTEQAEEIGRLKGRIRCLQYQLGEKKQAAGRSVSGTADAGQENL